MSPETKEVVGRMYEVLVDEIRTSRPELFAEAFTVAEIYQSLVPYRTHRERLGTEMNGDYEQALLQLLAGEGGYVNLESEAARRRLQEELTSIHPDTGIYRNFAACEVRLNPDRVTAEASSPSLPSSLARPEAPPSTEAAAGERNGSAESAGSAKGSARPVKSAGSTGSTGSTGGKGATGAEGDSVAGDSCKWCREELPDRDDLRFCPFCGSRTDLLPCPECGTELESNWLFCLKCGTEVQD